MTNEILEKKILVIEDNIAESISAQTELARMGFRDFLAVTTLSEGLEIMLKYDAVLSDLFFPAGNEPTEKYAQRFLPSYDQYQKRKFPKLEKDSIVLRAVQACAEVFEVTPQEYIENYMTKMDTPPSVLNAARDSLAGIKDSEKYKKFQKIEEEIRNGTNLPLGIIATERAKELKIPAVIVTSTYHHDDAFEAVQNLIKVPYCDNLIDGKKDWKSGIELLMKEAQK